MKWRKFDGYNETHQYVAADGQIIGEVTGSTFSTGEKAGWYARDERSTPSIWLGRYVSLELAKAAVERSVLTERSNQ